MLITYADPILGWIGHKILWRYGEHMERSMAAGEVYGFQTDQVRKLLKEANFISIDRIRFFYSLNNIIIAKKAV